MDKSIKLIQNSKFKIQHLITPILFFLLLSCSSPTETPKGSLSGTVNLEGLSDHSDIIVALYDLAVLDPDIVSINQQYPHIGVIINQHTEFDHRLQEPVKYTETDTEGHFEIKKIPTGTYNIIALKDSFGFKYIYEINIQDGENELSNSQFLMLNSQLNRRLSEEFSQRHSTKSLYRTEADITLYPETHISGNVSGSVTVETNHHLVIDDDTVFMPNTSSLTIQPGAVIRIEPKKDFTILGTLTAQGEENNMFTITSNYGYYDLNTVLYPQSPDEMINSIVLNCQNVEDEIIEWGKIQFLNLGISNYYPNLLIKNSIIEYSFNGFVNNQENFKISNSIIRKFSDVAILDYVDCEIHDNILIDNEQTIYLSDSNGFIFNNYFYNNYISVRPFYGYSEISNNCFEAGQYEISACASDPLIILNDFKTSYTSIETNRCYVGPQYDWCNPSIHLNNFYNPNIVISIYGYNTVPDGWFSGVGIQNDIDASNNFWFQNDIDDRIIDIHDGDNYPYPAYEVIYEPISINEVENSGIQ
jgi:parallel beta-helix repeat protein